MPTRIFTHTSTSAAKRAFSWMNWKRSSGFLPIRRSTRDEVSCASSSAISTRSSVRDARLHRCVPELGRHHLAQTLEAGNVDLRVRLEDALQQLLAVRVVARIFGPAALRQPVERRHAPGADGRSR